MIINYQQVYDSLAAFKQIPSEESEKYVLYCTVAAEELNESLSKNAPENKAVFAAVLLALYYKAVIEGADDTGEISFEAGDVSVKSESGIKSAEELKKAAYSILKDYVLPDSSFFFKAV